MATSNYLADHVQVWCPACGAKHAITKGAIYECTCGQRLSIEENTDDSFTQRGVGRRLEGGDAKKFLAFLANLSAEPSEEDKVRKFIARFRSFFPPWIPFDSMAWRSVQYQYALSQHPVPPELTGENISLLQIVALQNHIRAIWETSDKNLRQWRTVWLRQTAWNLTTHPSTNPTTLGRVQEGMLPPNDTLQQAMVYFQERHATARRCANPFCKTEPFFFADKPRQTHCSEECSRVTSNWRKLEYWNSKGKAARTKKSGAKKSKQGGRKHGAK